MTKVQASVYIYIPDSFTPSLAGTPWSGAKDRRPLYRDSNWLDSCVVLAELERWMIGIYSDYLCSMSTAVREENVKDISLSLVMRGLPRHHRRGAGKRGYSPLFYLLRMVFFYALEIFHSQRLMLFF